METIRYQKIRAGILKNFSIAALLTGITGGTGIVCLIKIGGQSQKVGITGAIAAVTAAVVIGVLITVLLGAFTARMLQRHLEPDLTGYHTEKTDEEIMEEAQSQSQDSSGAHTLLIESERLSEAAEAGNFNCRADCSAVDGMYQQILQNMNQIMESSAAPCRIAAAYLKQIRAGLLPEKIDAETKGDAGMLYSEINGCIDALERLLLDAELLSREFSSGNFGIKVDSQRHEGGYRQMITGLNVAFSSVVAPLHTAAERIEQIGIGVIPEKITEQYQGEFDNIKNSINDCIDGLNAIGEGSRILRQMSKNNYSMTMEGTYAGIYEKMRHSINNVIATVRDITEVVTCVSDGDLSKLEELKRVGSRGENDVLIPSLIRMLENVKLLVEETSFISDSAVEGRLSARGDTGKFKGEFKNAVEGINRTLDAVARPMEEVLEVLKQMSEGDLQGSVQGAYRGDHGLIKEALNGTLESLRSYVKEIAEVLSEISDCNLDLEVTMEYKGDFVQIGNSLRNIIMTLNQVMGNFSDAADQVSAGSRQVSDGSQFLAQGSTEQASSIQELSASVAEIAEKSKDNAVRAKEVYLLAKEARDGGAKGKETMLEMLRSMKEISDSSANISKIIKVIDDIAFQTNILALNAAVEAARAGQHGKGFAVVAEEVRSLAARSAKAAEETTDLIEGSMQKVQTGTSITNEIASVLKTISEGAVTSTEKLSVIAQESEAQALGIVQINQGIDQISKVVQNNSATAEQSAAASEELSAQADLLKKMIGEFQLNTERTYQLR